MRIYSRPMTALLLTVTYLFITLSPLAPLAMRSPQVAHAITGECAGDCTICGCSAERSANHTCCCWQKKLKHRHDADQGEAPDCCRKKPKNMAVNCPTKDRFSDPQVTCSCPCGSNKLVGLWGGEKFQQFPPKPLPLLTLPFRQIGYQTEEVRLTDRTAAPPDPPPKLV